MELPASVAERLARLAPDQRAAATAPPGPVLCIAPAGSGKTTTLVARVAWLVATGADPSTIAAITFNRRAAEELRSRLDPALEPLGLRAGAVRVRTFHALGLEILRSTGRDVRLVARADLLADAASAAGLPAVPATLRRLDDAFSRLKLDLRVTSGQVAADPSPGPVARAFLAYQRALAEASSLDFDDLVAESLLALEADDRLRTRWRGRCGHLLVDEVQDVDASQLALALLLAAPANRVFLVGDDDQSIYGWRLADVRRVLGLAARLRGLRRVDLTVNYRCPRPVVERAGRLVANNRERFAKEVRPRAPAPGNLVLAPVATAGDASAETVAASRLLESMPGDGGTRAILARTRRELLPAAAHALAAGLPFRADGLVLPVEDPRLDALFQLADGTPAGAPPLLRLGMLAAAARADRLPLTHPPGLGAAVAGDAASRDDPTEPIADDGAESAPQAALLAALLAWAVPVPTLDALRTAVMATRARLAELRRPDAGLILATAHATKGLEFDHVAVIGCSEGRFPSPRALGDTADPERALEEERRLAYVAWTRARRTLILAYEPAAPSRFLAEAFDLDELPGPESSGWDGS